MRNRGWILAIVVLAIGAIAIAVGLGYRTNGSSSSPSVERVRVAQTGDFLIYAGLYLAQDGGFFKRHGLDVVITNTGGDEKSVAAVIAGQADLGVGDPTFAAIANARGQDVKLVASLVNGVPFWGITYDPAVARAYQQSGLQGLTVATFPAPSTAYALQREMFETAGLPPAIKEGAFGSLAGILERGEAQVALELEPNVSQAQQRGAIVLYSMAQRHREFAITGVTVSSGYATSHPRVVDDFCRSLNEAYAYARSNPEEAIDLLAKRFPELSRRVIADALTRMAAEGVLPTTSEVNPEAWRRAIALRAKVGDIADPAKAFTALDPSYSARARQRP